MTSESTKRQRLLDPISRCSEILFGLIMALTFTGSLSVATAGREEIREMLVGAIGCNIAWGLVDAVMFLVTRLIEEGREARLLREVQGESDVAAARRTIARSLPDAVAAVLGEDDLERVRLGLRTAPSPRRATLKATDFLAAVAVFLLVFLSTLPVVVPFMLVESAARATRISNAVAIVLMFLCGYQLGNYADHRPWRMGLGMALLGSALVALTIALGG